MVSFFNLDAAGGDLKPSVEFDAVAEAREAARVAHDSEGGGPRLGLFGRFEECSDGLRSKDCDGGGLGAAEYSRLGGDAPASGSPRQCRPARPSLERQTLPDSPGRASTAHVACIGHAAQRVGATVALVRPPACAEVWPQGARRHVSKSSSSAEESEACYT